MKHNVLRRTVSALLLGALALLPAGALAGPAEDYQEARLIYRAAAACMAAYQDRNGNLAFAALEQEGWELRAFQKNDVVADAKFFLMRSVGADGYPDYLLAVAGTETSKDVASDLRWGKVPYGGKTRAEFEEYSQRKELPADVPRVHKGFHQYVQAMLALKEEGATLRDEQRNLLERLENDPKTNLFLVGHSLGGAAATLLAARLVDMGVPADRLKIITFGAPAVGNAAFAEREQSLVQPVRYINRGDPVPELLTQLVGGYRQFGAETSWEVPKTVAAHPHSIAAYVDYAMKNYYDKRAVLEDATKEPITLKGAYKPYLTQRGYVAPLENELPVELNSEFSYMNNVLTDEYWRVFAEYVKAPAPASLSALLEQAKEQQCEVLLVPTVSARRIKDEKQRYYITLQQVAYRVSDGKLLGGGAYGCNTKEFTPLEALLHDAHTMTQDANGWLLELKK